MSEQFELVHEVDDYYDGPRTGLADYRGVRYRFRSLVWPVGESWNPEEERFELRPETGEGPVVIARGVFRVRQPVPDLPPGVLRPLEVQWTEETR